MQKYRKISGHGFRRNACQSEIKLGKAEIMIYIFSALYCEAGSLIRHFRLKKEGKARPFDEFVNETEKIRLVLTGVGSVAAASAVSSCCTRYAVGEGDFIVNYGCCAGEAERGTMFLCNKLTEMETGRTFYPDILYRHPFREAALITGSQVVKNGLTGQTCSGDTRSDEVICYDMEATAIYQAGAYFVHPHQMIFLKTVSDRGDGEEVTAAQLNEMLRPTEELEEYFDTLQCVGEVVDKTVKNSSDEGDLARLCADLHCSKTMEAAVRQLFHYLTLSGTEYGAVLEEMYRDGRLPCRDRREGKRWIDEFRQQIL